MLTDVQIPEVMALVVPPVTELRRAAHTNASGQPMFPTIVAVRHGRVLAAVRTPRMVATLSCAQTMAVGLGADALVVAAQGQVEGKDALAYSVMTRDRVGAFALQWVQAQEDGLAFSTPFNAGEPQDPEVVQALADAMGQEPLTVTQVRRRDISGTFGEDLYLPAEQGRVVVDAGTVKTLQERVQGIGGQALYLPRSPEAGQLALESGLPRVCLVEAAR